MQLPFLVLLFVGIPEGIALATLACSLAKVEFTVSRVIAIGCFLTITTYLVRLLPITFGIHTIFSTIILFFLLNIYLKVDAIEAIKASLITYAMLVLFEAFAINLTMYLLDLSRQAVLDNVSLRILVGLPHVFLILAFAYSFKKRTQTPKNIDII